MVDPLLTQGMTWNRQAIGDFTFTKLKNLRRKNQNCKGVKFNLIASLFPVDRSGMRLIHCTKIYRDNKLFLGIQLSTPHFPIYRTKDPIYVVFCNTLGSTVD